MSEQTMTLARYSMGIGDRFGHQGKAQLLALAEARRRGVEVTPVWNKSNREHSIIGTTPSDTRAAADAAVRAAGWGGAYHVDADHIGRGNVDRFIAASDFFTLDVAEFTGKRAREADIEAFVRDHRRFVGRMRVPGIASDVEVSEDSLRAIAGKYLLAVQEAGLTYRHIAAKKGAGRFVTEVSMDETDSPQTPVELLFILSGIAREGIPAQTIAPKFTGRFNKGVDYVGDVSRFASEFEQDIAVVAFAVREFGLPPNLKLSVHSGSDKFSLYPVINRILKRSGAGLHLKTAGTTWLEELVGLAEAGGDGVEIARAVYTAALGRFDEMCGPYAPVIEIDRAKLPTPEQVARWTGPEFAAALRHDPRCAQFNPNFRQLLHVGYKVAAEQGTAFFSALERHAEVIARNVSENILLRHALPVFGGRA
jgi:hypothetical protein